MIPFFRKIRKKMSDDNKPIKYFRYAIGEIILVTIGILLALQINNLNENAKTELLELRFLAKLQDNLVNDTIYYIDRINLAEKSLVEYEKYIPKSYQIQNNKEEFVQLMAPIRWDSENFTSHNSTFEELKNIGQLGIFKNISIKDSIISLYKEQDKIEKHIGQLNELTRVEFYKFASLLLKYDLYSDMFNQSYMFQNDEWEFINNPSSKQFRIIEGTVTFYTFKNKMFKNHFELLLRKTKTLIHQIDEELERRK